MARAIGIARMAASSANPCAAGAAAKVRLERWASRLQEACAAGRPPAVAQLFHRDCQWRDLVLLSWDIRTFQGVNAVAAALATCSQAAAPLECSLSPDPQLGEPELAADSQSVSGWLAVQTAAARGVARVVLRPDVDAGGGEQDLCSVLFTSMLELKGFEELVGARRPLGHELRAVLPGERTAEAKHQQPASSVEPYVLIVGGSQSGLMLAARLRRLQVPCVVVDAQEKPGGNWRGRYSSLHLHDPIWVCSLPYMPFPDSWPVYPSKDQFAGWLDMYAQAMEIDYRGSLRVVKAAYDEKDGRWEVRTESSVPGAAGDQPPTFRPAHVVLATGNCGTPNIPTFPGLESFEGQVWHPSQFAGCGRDPAAWPGRRCVVVGSNTSAHDVAQDLCEHSAEVTMLQRSPSCVVRTERIREFVAGAGYSEEALARGLDPAHADLIGAATPYALRVPALQEWVAKLKTEDASYYARLQQAGWQQNWGEDETGPVNMFWRRFCGYYFDIGASELIAGGHVRLHSGPGAQISRVLPRAVVLADGRELPCDVLVLATGYKSMTDAIAKIVSPEVAAALGPCWGLGSGVPGDDGPWEGELRNMWKPTAQPGLWLHGGNLQLCRFHSLHLALQLKARYERLDVQPLRDVSGGAARAGA